LALFINFFLNEQEKLVLD